MALEDKGIPKLAIKSLRDAGINDIINVNMLPQDKNPFEFYDNGEKSYNLDDLKENTAYLFNIVNEEEFSRGSTQIQVKRKETWCVVKSDGIIYDMNITDGKEYNLGSCLVRFPTKKGK